MIWRFALKLKDVMEIDDTLADALFESGCDDGSPWSSEGVAFVGFDREADSLEAAIKSAVGDIRRAGCEVDKVEIDHEELASWLPTAG